MSDTDTATDRTAAHEAFRADLVAAGLLVRTQVDGLYHRAGRFEAIVRGIEAAVTAAGDGSSEPLLFLPPVLPRDVVVRSDYLRSFPDLVGSIDVFSGSDRDHLALLRALDDGQDWTSHLQPAEVMLGSAACHALYPGLTGTLPDRGRRLEVQGTCFRHEPSIDPARMQSFRMHEFVAVDTPAACLQHRDTWIERALGILTGLGLPVQAVPANDPFFGRAGRMLSANQRQTELKFEIVCPVTSSQFPTAIASGNYHLDHFGAPFAITTADGAVAHSACFGFGLERTALALLATHGLDTGSWPGGIRRQLQL